MDGFLLIKEFWDRLQLPGSHPPPTVPHGKHPHTGSTPTQETLTHRKHPHVGNTPTQVCLTNLVQESRVQYFTVLQWWGKEGRTLGVHGAGFVRVFCYSYTANHIAYSLGEVKRFMMQN